MISLINLVISIAGALASLFLFFYAFGRTEDSGENVFLGFVALFLFLLFAWDVTTALFSQEKKERR